MRELRQLARRAYRTVLAATFGVLAVADSPRRLRARPYDPDAVRRILVIRFGLLGDAAMLTPALQALRRRFPAAQIDVVATSIQAPLLEALPFVDRVIRWDAGDLSEPRVAWRPDAWRAAARTVRELRAQRYDLAISAGAGPGAGALSSAVAFLSGAPQRVGYRAEALPATLTHSLSGGRFDRPWHDIVYNAALALTAAYPERPLGEMPWEDVPPTQVRVEPEARQRAAALLPQQPSGRATRALDEGRKTKDESLPPAFVLRPEPALSAAEGSIVLAASGEDEQAPLAILHPGATNGAAKRWPLPHWVALARRLAGDGWAVAVVGGPADRPLGERIARQAGAPVLDLTGKTTVADLLAVLERAGLVVSGDSGPMHLAVALGRPTVAIHGPTDPQHQGPFDLRRAIVVRHDLPCSPCYRLDRVANCPLGHTLCQWLITPDDVYAAARDLLARVAAEESDQVVRWTSGQVEAADHLTT